jgi:hypothetical protein
MSDIRITLRRNPWRLGNLNDIAVKLEKLDGRSQTLATIRDLMDTLRTLESSLAAIEREDANRAAAQEAARKFRNQI